MRAAQNSAWFKDLQEGLGEDGYGLGGGTNDRFIWALAWNPSQRIGRVFHGSHSPEITPLGQIELSSDSIQVVLVDAVDAPGGPVVVGRGTLPPALTTGIRPSAEEIRSGSYDPFGYEPGAVLLQLLETWPAAVRFLGGG